MAFEMKSGKLCPNCEKGTLTEALQDLSFTYKGVIKTFLDETVYPCTVCDFEGVTKELSKRMDSAFVELRDRRDKEE